ncbi:MAG: metallophosphoesterase family protein [Oscillospiraceae bacterium]|jgi:hypothetical protein|nr:metallophosphoesterase family protein [Oscillospiraceae bacterium]
MPERELRFRDGRFKILHFTDIQDAGEVHPCALRLMEAALDRERPDLVVFTGDQIQGYSPKLKGAKAAEAIVSTIRQILAPLEARGIPFTFTFGNHDMQSQLPLPEQFAVYAASPLCLAEDTPGVSGCGNHHLLVRSGDGSRILFSLYLLDSHGAQGVAGYEPLAADQVDWFRRVRDALAQQAGDPVPALLFQHIPVPNVYDLLRPAPKGKGAVRGFRFRRKHYYILPEPGAAPGSVFVETPCVPDTDTGLFAAAQERGDVLGMYFGHDHKNAFAAALEGIDLGYTPGAGFAAYGPGKRRGARVFELRETNPRDYQSRVITYQELLGDQASLPLGTRLMDLTPTSTDDALAKLPKLLLALAGIAAVVAALVWLL